MKVKLQGNLKLLEDYSNNCKWNRAEYGDTRIGIICSGDCYLYAREVLAMKPPISNLVSQTPCQQR